MTKVYNNTSFVLTADAYERLRANNFSNVSNTGFSIFLEKLDDGTRLARFSGTAEILDTICQKAGLKFSEVTLRQLN